MSKSLSQIQKELEQKRISSILENKKRNLELLMEYEKKRSNWIKMNESLSIGGKIDKPKGNLRINIESGSFSGIMEVSGVYGGRNWFTWIEVENPDDQNPIWSCLWEPTIEGVGGWVISGGTVESFYYSLDDVDDPTQCVNWNQTFDGILPLPTITNI